MKIKEEWISVNQYYNYMISNFGKVLNTKTGRILNPIKSKQGYLKVNLYINGKGKMFYIHRLVAEHFVSGYKDGLQVNHIDGNKLNNVFTNLEWCTVGENSRHAYDCGLKKNIGNSVTPIKIKITSYDGETIISNSIREASKISGVGKTRIKYICENGGITKTGYKFEYEDIL